MKKPILALLLLVATLTAAAQQSLGMRAQTVSPQVNDDNTVTFRLVAPKAVTVSVVGDCITLPDQTAPMTEVDGVWQYTTPQPLAPELYSYAFLVDGRRELDPSNAFLIRDISTLFNVFHIAGDGNAVEDLYAVHDVPHGTVSKVWYPSTAFGGDRRLTVYTPAGYDPRGSKRYPVLYLLHGSGGDEEAWSDLGRAQQILDNLIAQGKAEPMIVVMTNGNGSQMAAPGQAPEGYVQPDVARSRGGAIASFELAFPEVVNYIDNNYRTIKKKSGRAIAGLSMGGFHSHYISRQYPDLFDYVGLFSSAANPRGDLSSPLYADGDAKLARQFSPAPALYYIAIGKDDFLYDGNVQLRKMLDDKGYPYLYIESDGGHVWRNWRHYLADFAPRLFKK